MISSARKEPPRTPLSWKVTSKMLNGVLDIVEPSEAKNHEQVASMIVVLKEP